MAQSPWRTPGDSLQIALRCQACGRALSIEEDPQVLDNLGMLYLVSGRHQEGRSIYNYLIRNYPDRNDSKLHYLSSDLFSVWFGNSSKRSSSKVSNGPKTRWPLFPIFISEFLFSDEAHFWLNGYVNKQNCRIWSEANPQVYVEPLLHPEKLTVWCALWAGGIIGPYFFKNDEGHNVTVNGDQYRAMITNFSFLNGTIMMSRSCGSNKTAQHVTQLVPQSIY
ncbi:uncharacterized protein TNCV_494461 [Trichonephila clavipes]|nr:uncharacterized protein TNCV_494461 [Trichonephila clavipes]